MSFLPGMRPVPFVTAGAPSVAYLDTDLSTSNLTTYSFAGFELGNDALDRVVVISVFTVDSAANSLSSGTINGTASTVVGSSSVSFAVSGGGIVMAAQMYLELAAGAVGGSTGTVAVTFSASAIRCRIGGHAMYGLLAASPDSSTTTSANPSSWTVTPPSGGIIVGSSGTFVASGTPSYSWSNLTEDFDLQGESALERYSVASTGSLVNTSTTFSGTASLSDATAGIFSSWR